MLVIRGELLKKYPTAVIYAQRARWQRTTDGAIDPTEERAAGRRSPPAEEDTRRATRCARRSTRRKVDPDIYFFGFDLTVAGGPGRQRRAGDDDPGWFFVIKERPGEPRFGFDLERERRSIQTCRTTSPGTTC